MLTAIILTLNEAHHVADCIDSVRWADSVLVVDSFSTDETVTLARAAGARLVQNRFENYSRQRNVALEAAQDADWVFFVDADERATPELAREIRRVIADRREVGWWAPRHNYIFGHRMRGAGWWPDYQLRLLRPDRAHYDPDRAVHEEAILDGETGHLENPLIHYNYTSLAQFRAKQRTYTDYDAHILYQNRVRTKLYTPYLQALRHFWWRFITLQGWRDGPHGILLSGLMGYYELVKYRKLRRLTRAFPERDSPPQGKPTP
ncbi:MAG: glycosyltransferase family 2 protein [Anaerolineae bacterium]|nr:glycosyltransferase family 2 protein [Anaerolineae bacterium]